MKVFLSALCALATTASAAHVVTSKLVEGLPSPLSVPTTAPRFSWQLQPTAARNVTQHGYRLRIGTTAELAAAGSAAADACDTGYVASATSWLIEPPCPPLAAGGLFWWSVSVTASDGSASAFSPPQRFAVGLQTRADWSGAASFIGMGGGAKASTPWLRTRFELGAADLAAVRAGNSAALLHVASAGFHEAYLNGARLEPDSVLLPSASNLNKRVLAHTYDVGESEAALLVEGTNTLGLWASPGWASLNVGGFSPSLSRYPLVMAELRVTPHDKQAAPAAPSLSVTTGNASGWEAAPSNMAHVGGWQWGNYGGEAVDHTLDQPGWATNDGGSEGWTAAVNYDALVGARAVTPEHVDSVGAVETVAAVAITPCSAPSPAPSPPPPTPTPEHSDCPAKSGLLGGVRSECHQSGHGGGGKPCSASDNLTLQCQSGGVITSIDFASWGTATGECGSFKASSCNSTASYSTAAAACLGKSSCSLVPARDTWETADPCFDTVKHLSIQASGCTPAPSAAEGAAEGAAPTCYKVKFAKLLNGWLDASALPAAPGATVTFKYSANEATAEEWAALDTVRIGAAGGAGADSFTNRFNWHTFQYVTITGLSAPPALSSFHGRRLANKLPRVGAFNSDNALLDSVYEGFAATNEGLTISGMFVDCPNRERFGYGGDAQSHIEFAMATYGHSHAFFSKWQQDWVDMQEGNGDLPNSAPTSSGSGGPAWGAISTKLPYELHRHTGDVRALRAAYPTARRFLQFVASNIDNSTGLVRKFGAFLGDWQTPHGCESAPRNVLFNNAFFVHQLGLAGEVAAAVGAPANDTAAYASWAATVGAAVHDTYYDSSAASYAVDGGSVQGDNVVCLMAGLVPDAAVDGVLASLEHQITVEKQGHLDTGTFNTWLMAKLLAAPAGTAPAARKRRDALLLQMAVNPTAPGYGYLVSELGLSTWPEKWSAGSVAGGASLLHGTLNGFGLWFPQGLLGVQPTGTPGRVDVFPAYEAGLGRASGAVATPLGAVSVSWQAAVGTAGIALNLTVPFNTVATVRIPAKSAAAVTEGSGAAAVAATFLRQEGADTVWLVGSGSYRFRSVLF